MGFTVENVIIYLFSLCYYSTLLFYAVYTSYASGTLWQC